jgi:hypothetical protein
LRPENAFKEAWEVEAWFYYPAKGMGLR